MTPRPSAAAADQPRASALEWLGFLSDEMRSCDTDHMSLRRVTALLARPASDVRSTFIAGNLTALLLFRARRLDDARALCQALIRYALAEHGGSRWPELAAYALQPEINLLRIEGYCGDIGAALGGLAQLGCLAQGMPAQFTALVLDESATAAVIAAGFDLGGLARNILVVETSKILWRRGQHELLRERCADFLRRWPRLAATGGPAHASEAPWLLGGRQGDAHGGTAAGGLAKSMTRDASAPAWQRRAAQVRLLHTAAHAARDGRAGYATDIALALYGRRSAQPGPWASALTPVRWDASLTDTMIRVGLRDEARTLTRELLGHLGQFHDPVLYDGLAERARLLGLCLPGTPGPPAGAGSALDTQRDRLLDRLNGGRH